MRTTKGAARNRAKNRLFKKAKGYVGVDASCCAPQGKPRPCRQVAYRDRRNRKRDFRRLWIIRINAAARSFGLRYSEFIAGLVKARLSWTARSWPTWPSRPARVRDGCGVGETGAGEVGQLDSYGGRSGMTNAEIQMTKE